MSGILDGIRVLELARYIAGPYCGMCLADMGAEVIKVEKKGSGEGTRLLGPWKNGKSLYFPAYNRNKKSITVDFRSEEGKALLRELVKKSDVIIENFRPGVMAKMGMSYEELKAINPRIILVSVSGFGQTGPYKNRTAFDGIISAMAGMARSVDGAPPIAGNGAISDTMAAMNACIGTLLALYDRTRTGVGQHVDVSMLSSSVVLQNTDIAGYAATKQKIKWGADSAPYGVCKAKDGWININAARIGMFKNLQKLIPDPNWMDPEYDTMPARVRDRDKLMGIIENWMADKTCDEIEKKLTEMDIPASIVADPQRILENPHLQATGQIVNVEVPGVGDVPYCGFPVKLSERPVERYDRAPELGEHNSQIYGELLGKSQEELNALVENGII